MRLPALVLSLAASTAAFGGLLWAAARPARETPAARAGALGAAERARVEAAVRRGVAHLVATQNPSGSWGKCASNLWDIYAPVPGSYYAFETAVTGLAVSALLEAAGSDPGAAAAARRGADWLVAHHAKALRVSPDTIYNVWAHAYALEAFARLLGREEDPRRRASLRAAAQRCVDLLSRYEFVDGGWGYYNFGITVRRPAHGATSFTTATVLTALAMAREQGVEAPRRLVDRAFGLIGVSRNPDWTFGYSWEHRYYPQGLINRVNGSLARTPACVAALAAWGRPVPASVFSLALDRLVEHGHFLLIARKYPRPHESWYANSGYFCFYGFYYASGLMDRVPAPTRARFREWLVSSLLPLQEEDGSWWDYQIYGYHKPYGTAFVLMALARCLG